MTRPRFIRINLDDSRRTAQMLRSGLIWRIPAFWPKAMAAIRDGLVPLDECREVPADVAALLGTEPLAGDGSGSPAG